MEDRRTQQNEVSSVRDTLLSSSTQSIIFFEQLQHLPTENDFAYCEEQLESFQFLSAKHNKKKKIDNDSKDSVALLAHKFIESLRWVKKGLTNTLIVS